MRPLAIAFVVLVVAAYSNMSLIDRLEYSDFLAEEPSLNIRKRDTESGEDSQEDFNSFIEEKLMHQSQALEHLVTVVDNSGDLIKKLIENLSKGIEKPNLPSKARAEEVLPPTDKNSNNNNSKGKDNLVLRLGKNIPKYGKLAKDLILTEVKSGTDPTPLIEIDTTEPLLKLGSRRSFGGNPPLIPSQQSDDNKVNPWCPIALICQKTDEPVCGFDDEFGYGKFDDFCHMLRVNCYWKYNFSLVNSCRPTL